VKTYQLIAHTADFGIRLKGKDLPELFQKAALAVFDIVAQKKKNLSSGKKEIKISLHAEDIAGLFISWLNELLSLSATRKIIFSDIQILKLENNHLEALAKGEDIENYTLNTEIKAATYHDLELKQVPGGWQAKVIFDV